MEGYQHEQKTEGDQPNEDTGFKPIEVAVDNPEMLQVKLEAITEKYMGYFAEWEGWRKPYDSLWNEIYSLYMSYVRNVKTPTRAKIFIPVVFQVVESATSKFISLIFNQEDLFQVLPDDPKDEGVAGVIQKLLTYQLGRANFFIKFVDFLKQVLLYGTSFFYVYWKVERKWVWERTPIVNPLFSIAGFNLGKRIVGWEEKKSYKVVERRPEIDVIDPIDVFPDPDAKDEITGRGIFIRSWISKEELKELSSGPYPVYANCEDDRLNDTNSKATDSDRQIRSSYRGVNSPINSKGMVELLTFWGNCDLDDDGIKEECQIVWANRQVIIRAVANPFHHQKRPIVRTVLFPVPGEFYGIGMIEPIIPLQHELNTLRRQRLDNINLRVNNMWKVNSLSDVDIDTLISSPNGIILTDDMSAVEAIVAPDATASSFNEAQIVQADIENVTTPRSVQGIPESGRLGRTARGAQLIIGQAMEKFGTSAKFIEEGIKRVLRLMHQLNLQFLGEDDVAREIGVVGHIFDRVISPDMIRAEVQFRMVGISDMIGKEGKINQLINFFGVFKQVLTPEAMTAIARKVFELQGMDPDLISAQNPMPGAVLPNAGEDQVGQALQAQVAQNGSGGTPAIPGVNSQQG